MLGLEEKKLQAARELKGVLTDEQLTSLIDQNVEKGSMTIENADMLKSELFTVVEEIE